jgi:UDP-2,4-diacetamido-2,4,6-trideoxy-beta-L-altropyranose hydrolase
MIRERGFAIDVLSDDAHQASPIEELKPAHALWLGVDWLTDARQTRAALTEVRLNWLVVDHYALDARWERALRSNCDRLMVIDDLADRPHDCDLLIDQSFGHSTAQYVGLLPQSCVVLVGPRYALLGHEFAASRDYSLQRRAEPQLKTLLIAMGGVDRSNASGRVLQALRGRQLPADIVLRVVMGPRAPWLHEVHTASAQMPCRADVLLGVRDMAQLMAESDLAIGAAGGTSWERCCLGLPTILLILARNQEGVAKALSARGAAICVGDIVSGPERAASEAVRILAEPKQPLRLLSQISSELCDGKGVGRVAHEIFAIADVSMTQ